MTILAAVLFALALASRRPASTCCSGNGARPTPPSPPGAPPTQTATPTAATISWQLNGLMELLLGNDTSRHNTIALLLLGAILGAAGNYASLSW